MTELHIINGPMKGRAFDLREKTTVLGRSPECDISINETSVSRRHAQVSRKGETLYIEDLNSQNGTWVNGHPINSGFQVSIKEGDTLALGNICVSVGEPFTEDGMVAQYAISLSDLTEENRKELLYKDRRITDRDRLEMIYDVSTVLLQSLDIDEICEEIIDALFTALPGIESGSVILLDHATGEHKKVAARARSPEQDFGTEHSRTIVNRVIEEGKAIMLSDTRQKAEQDLSASIILMQIRSVMCVPLISKSQIYGVIYVHSTSALQGFRKDDLFLLTALGIPAALAVENALLYAERRQAEQALQNARDELEIRVQERTNALSEANARLTQEIAERKQAEDQLKATHEQLKEANRNLGLAYAQMRDSKDRLATQLYGEELAFIADENGLISGVNEKALEATGLTRGKVLGRDLGDLLDKASRKKLQQDMRDAAIGIFHQTSLRLKEGGFGGEAFQVRLMPLYLDHGKMLLVLMRLPEEKESP
jgi:pSer/pThr/pTyr-binding forkhead associated (FHA) protein